MFCPKCGTANNDDPKFCRSCGENLKVISEAMTRRLPAFLLSKMDAYIETKYRRLHTESIGSAVLGGIFIFLGFYDVIGAGASWASKWFYVAFGCFMLLVGLWDHMVYKRSLSTEVRIVQMPAASNTNELSPHDKAQILEPPASVTEFTTRQLDTAPRGEEKT